MSASLPGSTTAENLANPSAGNGILFSPFSGPKGSPFAGPTGDLSTGALNTGIGFGPEVVIGVSRLFNPAVPSTAGGFTDDSVPGWSLPNGAAATDSRLTAIGGGRSTLVPATAAGVSTVTPYTQGFGLCGAGNGASRDAGGGAGFVVRAVTATADTANGVAVEPNYINRSGQTVLTAQSTFGSNINNQGAPA